MTGGVDVWSESATPYTLLDVERLLSQGQDPNTQALVQHKGPTLPWAGALVYHVSQNSALSSDRLQAINAILQAGGSFVVNEDHAFKWMETFQRTAARWGATTWLDQLYKEAHTLSSRPGAGLRQQDSVGEFLRRVLSACSSGHTRSGVFLPVIKWLSSKPERLVTFGPNGLLEHMLSLGAHMDVREETKWLLDHPEEGVSLDARTKNGTSVLVMAVNTGRFDLVHQLLVYGANPNAMDEAGSWPLTEAWLLPLPKMSPILDVLHRFGADPRTTCPLVQDGSTTSKNENSALSRLDYLVENRSIEGSKLDDLYLWMRSWTDRSALITSLPDNQLSPPINKKM